MDWLSGLTKWSLLTSTILLSCAHGISPDPEPIKYQVIIDDSFSVDETDFIVHGFDSWQSVIGTDLTFQYLTASTDSINAGLDNKPKPGILYVIRVQDVGTVDCLLMASTIACVKPPNRVYFQADSITATSQWTKLAVHEAGHVIGLPHTTDSPSVMLADINQMADTPSIIDVQAYCSLPSSNGCPHRRVDSGH